MKSSQKNKMTRSQEMRIRKQRQNIMFSKTGIIIIIILFVCCLGILCQRLIISGLDQQVQKLKTECQELQSKNDAKQGQLTESQKDTEIKATARSYGMTEAGAGQKIVETVSEQTIDDSGVGKNRWYNRLFK